MVDDYVGDNDHDDDDDDDDDNDIIDYSMTMMLIQSETNHILLFEIYASRVSQRV